LALPLIVVTAVTVAAQLASLAAGEGQHPASVFLTSAASIALVTLPLAGLGLWLGQPIGLGAPLLTRLLLGQRGSGRQLLQDTKLAIPLGLGVGAFLLILRIVTAPLMPPELPALGHRGTLGGLAVSVGAAVGEEVWLRLGVMSVLAWLLLRISDRPKLEPRVAWTAILLTAFLFGLIHLPQLAAAGAATPISVSGTIVGNTVVGTACGWLYWRRSLIAAILAHFSVDIVLHVLTTLSG
jgi:membrane protease YdiL (CAAX protease family)